MGVSDWRNHDLRRVVRSGLARLKVPTEVAEMVIGHGHGNTLQRTYNVHAYEQELREALATWARHIQNLVAPPDPKKVISFQGAA
jgi:hypothetical protein